LQSDTCPKERVGRPFLWGILLRLLTAVMRRSRRARATESTAQTPAFVSLPPLAASRIPVVAVYDPTCMLCVRSRYPDGSRYADGMCQEHMLLVYHVDLAVEEAARPIGSAPQRQEAGTC
jgi:hypothetical protein